jgi:hypothetical protein
MATHKELFQLAQGRGYELNFVDAAKMSLYEPLELIIDAKNIYLLELTLIQKWLRDELKISVLPIDFIKTHYGYKIIFQFGKSKPKEIIKCSFGSIWESYEAALLEGIAEALKLI